MASLKILLNIALISNGVCEGSIKKCVSPYAYTVVVKGDVCKFMFQQVLIVHCGPNHCRERTVLHLIQRNTNGTNTSDGFQNEIHSYRQVYTIQLKYYNPIASICNYHTNT